MESVSDRLTEYDRQFMNAHKTSWLRKSCNRKKKIQITLYKQPRLTNVADS